jgi:hypothetical protein
MGVLYVNFASLNLWSTGGGSEGMLNEWMDGWMVLLLSCSTAEVF